MIDDQTPPADPATAPTDPAAPAAPAKGKRNAQLVLVDCIEAILAHDETTAREHLAALRKLAR